MVILEVYNNCSDMKVKSVISVGVNVTDSLNTNDAYIFKLKDHSFKFILNKKMEFLQVI